MAHLQHKKSLCGVKNKTCCRRGERGFGGFSCFVASSPLMVFLKTRFKSALTIFSYVWRWRTFSFTFVRFTLQGIWGKEWLLIKKWLTVLKNITVILHKSLQGHFVKKKKKVKERNLQYSCIYTGLIFLNKKQKQHCLLCFEGIKSQGIRIKFGAFLKPQNFEKEKKTNFGLMWNWHEYIAYHTPANHQTLTLFLKDLVTLTTKL